VARELGHVALFGSCHTPTAMFKKPNSSAPLP
jgi:hypothetical protein